MTQTKAIFLVLANAYKEIGDKIIHYDNKEVMELIDYVAKNADGEEAEEIMTTLNVSFMFSFAQAMKKLKETLEKGEQA